MPCIFWAVQCIYQYVYQFFIVFHSFLLARLRTATLRHDDEGQVSLFFAKTVLQ